MYKFQFENAHNYNGKARDDRELIGFKFNVMDDNFVNVGKISVVQDRDNGYNYQFAPFIDDDKRSDSLSVELDKNVAVALVEDFKSYFKALPPEYFDKVRNEFVDHKSDYNVALREYFDNNSTVFLDNVGVPGFSVHANFFSEKKAGQEYFKIPVMDKQVWFVECPENGSAQSAVAEWMLKNHPDYYMGYSGNSNFGGFLASAVPCPEYPKGQWESWRGRFEHAKQEASKFLIQAGPIEHDRYGNLINIGEGDIVLYHDRSLNRDYKLKSLGFAGEWPKRNYEFEVLESDLADMKGMNMSFSADYIGRCFSDIDSNGNSMHLLIHQPQAEKYLSTECDSSFKNQRVRDVPDIELASSDFGGYEIG